MADIELVIKIPEEQYRTLNAKSQNDVITAIDDALLIKAIKKGTPIPDNASILSVTEFADKCRECGKNYVKIPDNATNGEVFGKIMDYMFMDDAYITTDKHGYLHLRGVKDDWWNAPYQKGGKE